MLRSKINITDLILTAHADREKMEDVRVTTLKSEFQSIIHDMALEVVLGAGKTPSKRQMDAAVKTVLDTHPSPIVCEGVRFDRSGIEVIVDAAVVDDSAVWRAVQMVSDAMQLRQPGQRFVQLGHTKTFSSPSLVTIH